MTLDFRLLGAFSGGVTPVLIPNTEVKPRSTDGTRKGRVGRRQNKVLDFYFTPGHA